MIEINCPHNSCGGIIELSEDTIDEDGTVYCYHCGNYFPLDQANKIPNNTIIDDPPEYDGDYPLDLEEGW